MYSGEEPCIGEIIAQSEPITNNIIVKEHTSLNLQVKYIIVRINYSFSTQLKDFKFSKHAFLFRRTIFFWFVYLYNKTRHSYIYMFPIAGQTAGPIGLKFLWTLGGGRGWYKLNSKKKCQNFFFHGQRRALQLVIYNLK